MADTLASLSAGNRSLILKLSTPTDWNNTKARNDLSGIKVWCSTTAGFTPADATLVFNGPASASISIPNLLDNTTYYVRYAFLSSIDPTVFTYSKQYTQTTLTSTTGATGAATYRIYIAAANNAATPTTPGTTQNGATPAGWSASPVTLTGTQAQFQSDGSTPVGDTTTTWSAPYLSYFKVDTLEAITANTGNLTVTGTFKAGNAAISGTSMTSGTAGGVLYNGGNFAFGNSTTNITYNGTVLSLNGQVVYNSNIQPTTITGDKIVNGTLTADKIDARGLSIKDTAGNVILSAGSSVATSSFGGNVTGSVNGTSASTLVNTANNAQATAAAKLSKSGADILTGPINLNAANALTVGTPALDSVSGHNGFYIGSTGIVGTKNGVATFTLDNSGNAIFAGSLTAASGTFVGNVTGSVDGTSAATLVTTATTASTNATTAITNAATANANATIAQNTANSKLAKSGADILTGPINLNAANALTVGTPALDSVSGHNGFYIGSTGIVGTKNGVATFTLDNNGNAIFAGTLSAATGSFGGNVTGTVDGTSATTLVSTATTASTNATTAIANAATAQNTANNKLAKSGADTLVGPITLSTTNALLVGTVNDGVYIGSTGIVGRKASQTTFAVDASGNAIFKGDLTGASGTFAGSLSVGTTPPVISGTGIQTGTAGALINSGGTFALGNNSTNVTYNGSTLTLNGNIIATGNINVNAVTEHGGSNANNLVMNNASYRSTYGSFSSSSGAAVKLLQGSIVNPGVNGTCSIVVSIQYTPAIYGDGFGGNITYLPKFFLVINYYDSPLYGQYQFAQYQWDALNTYVINSTTGGSSSRVYYEVYAWDDSDAASGYSSNIYAHTNYSTRSLLVIASKR